MDKIQLKILLVFTVLTPFFCFAQDWSSTILKKGDKAYMNLSGDEHYFFVNCQDPDDRIIIRDRNKLSLKGKTISIYSKWINPLKYEISFKDSLYLDPRDKTIQEYIEKVLSQFNITNQDDEVEYIGSSSELSSVDLESFQFVREDLLELLEIGKAISTPSENVKEVFKILEAIERSEIKPENDSLKATMKRLFDLNDISRVEKVLGKVEDAMKKVTSTYKLDLYRLTQLQESLSNLNSNSERLLKLKITAWLKKESKMLEWNKSTVPTIAEYVGVVRKSIVNTSCPSNYYYLRTLELPMGKESLSKLEITTNTLKLEDMSLNQASVKSYEFIINRYDFIKPSVGTGLFYANTNLNSFGVSTNEEGQLTVSEDEVDKSTAVTALFLNLNFDLNSRYFSPLIQFGIDPTKERPFLLFGGGIYIPSSKFSLTFGPIWTWTASLEELEVGEVVESSTEVENNTNYSFDVEPQGFYLGLTYSF